jgi:toxin ParE1/3/4
VGRFTVLFDRDARADLIGIRDYIAKAASRATADSFIERVVTYCEGLGTLPHRGTQRNAIAPGLRTLSWRKTITIAFQVFDQDRRVVILGVFYRGRDVLSALRNRQAEGGQP